MSKISLLATDLDGTLFYDREHISAPDRAALSRLEAYGVTLVLATGRELHGILPAMDALQLWDLPRYCIHSGGGGLYDVKSRTDRTLAALSPALLREIYDLCKDLDISVLISQDEKFYTNHRTSILEREAKLLFRTLVEVPDFPSILTRPNAKFILNGTDEQIDKVLPIVTGFDDPRFTFHRSHDNYIDCYPAGISKGSALTLLCEELGLPLAETLGVGDNLNDLQLLETAGHSACPGDAHPEIRAMAEFVSRPAREGAVAGACEHFIFSSRMEA